MKQTRPAHYTRQADILAYALINDSPAVMGLDQLSPAIQADIVAARLHGYHPVSVRWKMGEFALMLCEPGINMPRPEKIMEAFYQCRRCAIHCPPRCKCIALTKKGLPTDKLHHVDTKLEARAAELGPTQKQ